MTDASAPAKAPVTPRPAATILLLRDDPMEVLMIRRHKDQFFSSALVFPGGLVDDSDHSDAWHDLIVDDIGLDAHQRALRIAGFRETFEETGILLARGAEGHCAAQQSQPGASFLDIVRASGGRLVLDDLVPFGHWITPEFSPKRFDTHFFICRTAPGQDAVCDGGEAVALEWATPDSILTRAAEGETSILFPTRLNIARLAESGAVDDAIAAARMRPIFTVLPRVEKRPGGMAVVIPAEAGYCETENFNPSQAPSGKA
ncbi:NUDIX hydrolase [Sphingobium sp. Sx8-8]|uniref:NUDIX hydrolase n=1 Tax=Sphingobium sp. Sx8-8 TaxID=2933617 RepID=UPI001F55BDD4